MIMPRELHACTKISNDRVMVGGGYVPDNRNTRSVEIYDSTINGGGGGWYIDEDLEFPDADAPTERILLYTENKNPIWINGDDIWKFENHQWIKLNSKIGVYAYGVADAILVPEDFVIPDSTTPTISTTTPITTQTV